MKWHHIHKFASAAHRVQRASARVVALRSELNASPEGRDLWYRSVEAAVASRLALETDDLAAACAAADEAESIAAQAEALVHAN